MKLPAELPVVRRAYAPNTAKRKAVARRMKRPPYIPPERTREWVETHYWKVRQNEDTSARVKVNEFWRDWTAAIAEGREATFLSDHVRFVSSCDNITPVLAALAATRLPFAAKEGDAGLVFKRDVRPAADGVQGAVS